MDTKTLPAKPEARKGSTPRETVAQKALRLYPERTVEPLGHGRYLVEGTEGFYEVDLAVFGGEESCPCPATKPCYHLVMATIHRAKRRAIAHKEQADRKAARTSSVNLAPLTAAL